MIGSDERSKRVAFHETLLQLVTAPTNVVFVAGFDESVSTNTPCVYTFAILIRYVVHTYTHAHNNT